MWELSSIGIASNFKKMYWALISATNVCFLNLISVTFTRLYEHSVALDYWCLGCRLLNVGPYWIGTDSDVMRGCASPVHASCYRRALATTFGVLFSFARECSRRFANNRSFRSIIFCDGVVSVPTTTHLHRFWKHKATNTFRERSCADVRARLHKVGRNRFL